MKKEFIAILSFVQKRIDVYMEKKGIYVIRISEKDMFNFFFVCKKKRSVIIIITCIKQKKTSSN